MIDVEIFDCANGFRCAWNIVWAMCVLKFLRWIVVVFVSDDGGRNEAASACCGHCIVAWNMVVLLRNEKREYVWCVSYLQSGKSIIGFSLMYVWRLYDWCMVCVILKRKKWLEAGEVFWGVVKLVRWMFFLCNHMRVYKGGWRRKGERWRWVFWGGCEVSWRRVSEVVLGGLAI